MQSAPGNEQLLLFYFTHDGNRTVMQLAEITLGDDGKLVCDRNRYAGSSPRRRTTRGERP